MPCRDAECENLYRTFLQYREGHKSSRAATAVLATLDRKRRDRWYEAVQNIDFSHSTRVAWSTLNNLVDHYNPLVNVSFHQMLLLASW